MNYRKPKSHTPRERLGSRPSPASSRARTVAGVRVTSARGASVVHTVVTGAAANTRPVMRLAADNAMRERVLKAIRDAFPVPRPFPGGGPARAFAAAAARYGEAAAQSADVAEQVLGDLKYVQDVVSGQWWQTPEPYSGPNLGLTLIDTRKHSSYGVGSGTWYNIPAGWGRYTNNVNQLVLSQNTWLRSTVFGVNPVPGGYLDNTMPPSGLVAAGAYLYVALGQYWKITVPTSTNFYAEKAIYRNLSGAALPGFVDIPGTPPLPLGVPLPAGLPAGYPLARPVPKPLGKRLPRPRPVEEVAIDIGSGPNPTLAVYKAVARKPGPKGKETKAYGKHGIASAVFWLYEATDDWTDWVNIIVSAIPAAPSGMSPTQQLLWLRENPHLIATAVWGEVIAGLAGWAVDEAFGAAVGDFNKRAQRQISGGGGIDMRTNVSLHWAQNYAGGGSPGSFVRDFILSFL